MKKLLAVLTLVSALVLPVSGQGANCTIANLIWSYPYAGNPLITSVCSGTINTNCYTQFVIVDPDPKTGGQVSVPITALPSPLATVDGIPSGDVPARHAAGVSWVFQVFVEIHDASGNTVRSLPNPDGTSVVTLTCGSAPPVITIPVAPGKLAGVAK